MRLDQLDLSDVAVWPWWLKTVSLAAAVALVLAVGYGLMLADQRRELSSALHRGHQLSETAEDRWRQAGEAAAVRTRGEQLRASLVVSMRPLPIRIDLPALIEDFSGAAADNGLTIESIHISEEVSDGTAEEFYAALPIAVEVTGTYHQFGAFLAALATLRRVVTLNDFEIERRGGALSLTLSVTAYRRTDQHIADVEAGGSAAPVEPHAKPALTYVASGRSPFEPEPSAANATGTDAGDEGAAQALDGVPLGRLRMVGTVAWGGTAFALVRAPTGHVHRLRPGDHLGLHDGRVTRVEFGRMELMETVSDGAGGWTRRLRLMETSDAADSSNRPEQEAAEPEHEANDRGEEE